MGLSQSNVIEKKMTQTSKGKQEFSVNISGLVIPSVANSEVILKLP